MKKIKEFKNYADKRMKVENEADEVASNNQ